MKIPTNKKVFFFTFYLLSIKRVLSGDARIGRLYEFSVVLLIQRNRWLSGVETSGAETSLLSETIHELSLRRLILPLENKTKPT